jgi:hypothetical protein
MSPNTTPIAAKAVAAKPDFPSCGALSADIGPPCNQPASRRPVFFYAAAVQHVVAATVIAQQSGDQGDFFFHPDAIAAVHHREEIIRPIR